MSEQAAPVRVVVIDDNEDMRLLVKLLLDGDDRFEVAGEAADGEAGLELLRSRTCDLVLLDLAMPGYDGLELLQLVRDESLGPVVVVVLSGFSQEVMAKVALGHGAAGYLEKGISLGRSLLSDVWALWRHSNERQLAIG